MNYIHNCGLSEYYNEFQSFKFNFFKLLCQKHASLGNNNIITILYFETLHFTTIIFEPCYRTNYMTIAIHIKTDLEYFRFKVQTTRDSTLQIIVATLIKPSLP